MSQRYLLLDYETRSEIDLGDVGGYEYANHPSTQIICLAWCLGTRETLKSTPIHCWSPLIHFDTPGLQSEAYQGLLKALRDPDIIMVSHNAFFEQVITRFVFVRETGNRDLDNLPVSRWLCTAALCSVLALPRALEGAGKVLGLGTQKDMEGRKLLLKMCKPRKATKKRPAGWHEPREDIERLMKYCVTDIVVERDVFLLLPPLTPTERQVWELDQEMNLRGFEVDRDLVLTVLDMVDVELTNLDQETVELTAGALSTTRKIAAFKEHLQAVEQCFLPNLQAKTITDAIDAGMVEGKACRLLEIRQAVSKSSTKKYFAAELRTITDGRCRDNVMYSGASTGRWSGLGLQPHNLPKSHLKPSEVEHIIRILLEKD